MTEHDQHDPIADFDCHQCAVVERTRLRQEVTILRQECAADTAEIERLKARLADAEAINSIDARFCGRLALILECVILDPHGHFELACQLLEEYKAEWEKVNPSPPTFMGEPMPHGTTANATDDSGNTLLRGTNGSEEPMPDAPRISAVINDALKPCPEIDAVTQEMADQAEIAYQVLSEALGLTPEQMSELTLTDLAATAAARLDDQPPPADVAMLASANRELGMRMAKVIAALHKAPVPFADAIDNDQHLVSNTEAIVAELIGEQVRASELQEVVIGLRALLDQIRHALDLSPAASSMDILAEIENISRLADRATQTGARDAVQGPYIIISDPRSCAGTYETIDEAKKHAARMAYRTTTGRAAIVQTLAEVTLVPQWSDAQ